MNIHPDSDPWVAKTLACGCVVCTADNHSAKVTTNYCNTHRPWGLPANVNPPPTYDMPPAPPPPPIRREEFLERQYTKQKIKCAIAHASQDSGYHPSDAQVAFLERLLQILL